MNFRLLSPIISAPTSSTNAAARKIMNIRVDDVHINNLQVIGAGNNWNMHKLAATLMADGIIDLKPLVTNVMPLDHYQEALEMAEKRPLGFVKAVFKP